MHSRKDRLLLVVVGSVLLASCGAGYITSELSGSAKPEGGIAETIPATRTFQAAPAAVRKAVLSVLDEQGFLYTEDKSAGSIKTDLKQLPNKGGSMMVAYSVRAVIGLEGSNVTYRARFDKKSSVVQAEANLEFPAKENELRRDFFSAVERKLKG